MHTTIIIIAWKATHNYNYCFSNCFYVTNYSCFSKNKIYYIFFSTTKNSLYDMSGVI